MIGLFAKGIVAAALAAGSPVASRRAPTINLLQDNPPAQAPTGGGQQNPNYFNPQIAVVSDFRWNAMNDDPTVSKRAFMKELELGIAADVDPFLRAEAYIAFADEDGETVAEVEEAFARYANLGRGLSAKAGKIAAAVGRVQRNHVDQLNWLDFPFVVEDMLGEEGLRAGGASVSYLFPGDRFNEITIEGLDAPDAGLFAGAHTGAPVFVGHYRTFFDFSEDASAQFGLTYANGPGSTMGDRSTLYGADFVYKWVPGAAGKSLVIESEALWGTPGVPGSDQVFGGFAAATYQFMPRVFGHAKYDYSEIPGTPDIRRAWTAGVTLKPTEFHHWRIEWQTISSNFEPNRNVLNLQFQWVIGAHPAHKY